MYGNPEFGALLLYTKSGGGFDDYFCSKGDISRIHQFVRTLHNDLRPVGLYIPFTQAWLAVKEFMETGGELPKSIAWIKGSDLPPNSFPDPFAEVAEVETHGYPWEKNPR